MFLVPFFDIQNFILLVRTVPFLRKIIFISSYTTENNYFLLYELIQDLPYIFALGYSVEYDGCLFFHSNGGPVYMKVSLKMLNSADNNSFSDLVSIYLKVFNLEFLIFWRHTTSFKF